MNCDSRAEHVGHAQAEGLEKLPVAPSQRMVTLGGAFQLPLKPCPSGQEKVRLWPTGTAGFWPDLVREQ